MRKIIGTRVVYYDEQLDIISYHTPDRAHIPLNRTQVDETFDLCAEITTCCNLSCCNCFSDSAPDKPGANLDYETVDSLLLKLHAHYVRFCATGGEPLLHPEIERFLHLPERFQDLAYVLTTNGLLRTELDDLIADQHWLVAISLHGREEAHNRYTKHSSFRSASRRIEKLCGRIPVHIYCVVHEDLGLDDVEWLLRFRTETGAQFLRLILPRNHGRFVPSLSQEKLNDIVARLDSASAVKTAPSKATLLDVTGQLRSSK